MKLVFNAIIVYFLIIHGQFSSALEIGIANATSSVLACNHNGTRFANGSLVPTIEPCLNCKCVNSNLICALRVCPEQPFPPPRGCVTVHKRDSCCPYITCSKFHSTNTKTQDKNVITHDRKWYEQNIKNRIFSQNAIQRRIDDMDFDGERIGNEKMCVHNGTVYRSGSAMSTSSLCSYCYCISGRQKCVEPKCTLPEKDCEPIFIDSSCCPIRYDCTPNKNVKTRYNAKINRRRNGNKHYLRMTSRMQRSRGCLVQSTFYPEGHKLPANETNPCEICFCIGGTKQCTPKKCAPTIKNCIPIIPSGQCCPSSYECNHRSNHARQYDLYSLFFGDENKENSTASWDYESDTEPTNVDVEVNSTSEKGFFDALRETLSQDLKKKVQNLNSTKASNGSGTGPSNTSFSIDEEDEEEISLLDFFLNGDTTATTPKVITFNVTGRPLANGMTNSPMQIKPVFAGSPVNESFKFAMLPASLYNMVNDDGKIMFDASKATERPITTSRAPLTNYMLNNPSSPINLQSKYELTTKSSPLTTKIPSKKPTIVAAVKPVKVHEALVTPITKIESSSFSNNQNLPSTTSRPLTTSTHYPESSTVQVEQVKTTTLSKTKLTIPPSKTVVTMIHSTQKTTQKPRTHSTTSSNLITSNDVSTQKPIIRQTTPAAQVLTTTIKSIVRTTPVPKLNPSILESDVNYDYSEPTLPPSLPNLKIIPFLPTDAVKNTLSKVAYKPNINYYQHQPEQQQYHGSYSDANSQNIGGNYSPFSSKPKPQNLFVNKADDRVDYDTYKPPSSNQDSEDYISIFSGTNNNGLPPQSIQMSVNSHLGYEPIDNKYTPPKIQSIPNKNLTVKPPLPPFEPEYEYELYNLPPNVQLNPTNNKYNQFSSSANIPNNAFSSEHNYNVPQFVTMPPMEIKNDDHRESVFSYSAKNNFIPPAKTEGGFVPKRIPTVENYIPLYGDSFDAEKPEPKDSIIPEDPIELKPKNDSHQEIEEKNIISITTDANYKLYDTSIRTNEVDPIEFATFSVSTNSPTITTTDLITSTISTSESTKKTVHKNASNQINSNTIPLKLITILNNSKKENPTKVEIPQRKNNKIIDPTDEPLIDATSIPLITTEMPNQTKNRIDTEEIRSPLRDIFLSAINRHTISDISEDHPTKSSVFLQRPINQLSPSFIGSGNFPGLTSSNAIDSKHSFQSNPIRSELDLIISELNKNKQHNEFSHTNNFSSENYQVLAADVTNISNTESYVVNPVDVGKLKQHQSSGETKIFTPPIKDPAGLFKLDGCNIYGRMYRVDRVIAELSSPCLECRCTEVGVSCTPLTC